MADRVAGQVSVKGLMRAVALSWVCALALAGVASAAPAPGDFDLAFGQQGYIGGDVYPSLSGTAMTVGPQGETFVLESRQGICGADGRCATELVVARFNRDGSRDPLFGSAAVLNLTEFPYSRGDIAVGPEGEPVVAAIDERVEKVGSQIGLQRRVIVARFTRNGELDPSFGSGGASTATGGTPAGTPPVVAVQQTDGKPIVAFEGSVGSQEGELIVDRLLTDGSPDKDFAQAGTAALKLGTQNRPADIALTEMGSFEVGLSECCKGEGGTGPGVTFGRFLTGGGFDPSLAATGKVFLPRGQQSSVQSIAVGPRGSIYAAVEEESRGSVVVRMLPSGGLDPAFGKGGEVALGPELGLTGVVQVAADSNGRVLGVTGRGIGVNVFRLRSNGTPDRTFGAGRGVAVPFEGENPATSGFGFQPNGRIVVLGEWGAGTRGYLLAALAGGESKARCLGKKATIVGTRGKDKIRGTAGPDVIAALGGADTVRGLGGEDRICGGQGRDSLFGGGGRDKVRQ